MTSGLSRIGRGLGASHGSNGGMIGTGMGTDSVAGSANANAVDDFYRSYMGRK